MFLKVNLILLKISMKHFVLNDVNRRKNKNHLFKFGLFMILRKKLF